jgi:hypothetical protein
MLQAQVDIHMQKISTSPYLTPYRKNNTPDLNLKPKQNTRRNIVTLI